MITTNFYNMTTYKAVQIIGQQTENCSMVYGYGESQYYTIALIKAVWNVIDRHCKLKMHRWRIRNKATA